MKIHEYQAKELFRAYGVATPEGRMATTVPEARQAAEAIGGPVWVVKAQIHAGGRGKGGGVKLARSVDEAETHAKAILGMQLKTHQTGPEGQLVRKVLVEKGSEIARELYLGITLDRDSGRVTFIVSAEGGMDIEEVADKHPDKILREPVDPTLGFMPYQARRLAFALGLDSKQARAAEKMFAALYRLFIEKDAALVEVNPLIVTKAGELVALDGKVSFDGNGLFRHPDIEQLRDEHEEDARELEAARYGLSYVSLDGNIGCLVNGAGLAMTTLDAIKLYGGDPANFLDVGGGANRETVTQAFKIILGDARVKAILVNIFGGIMKCDIIAEGVVAAAREVGLKVPLVVRLQGTNVDLGKKILAESGLPIISADDLAEAGQKAVAAARGATAR